MITPGRYRHYKGREYHVIGVAQHSETEETFVVYRALYGAGGLWIRPVEMFTDSVIRDGKKISRFTWIDEGDHPALPDLSDNISL